MRGAILRPTCGLLPRVLSWSLQCLSPGFPLRVGAGLFFAQPAGIELLKVR